MNRGTKEGTIEEKLFCEKFNRGELNLENTDLNTRLTFLLFILLNTNFQD